MSSQPKAPPDDPGDGPSYEVGYGKPPQATRFQPGKSGNPKGRPKGSKKVPPVDGAVEKLKALVLQEAYRLIKIKDGETVVELPTIQAAVRNVTLSAAKGNQRAQRMLFDFVGGVEGERRRELQQFFEVLVLSKQRGEEQIASARLRGLPAPVLVPHPDHLIIDPMVGSVKLRGPYTPEEKVKWDQLTAMKANFRNQVAELEAGHRTAPRSRDLKNAITTLWSVIARIDTALNSFERVLLEGLD
jgi:hypothetical protein